MSRPAIGWSAVEYIDECKSNFWNDELINLGYSDSKGLDMLHSYNHTLKHLSIEFEAEYTNRTCDRLKNSLIQDCMWPSDHLKGQNITFQKSLKNSNMNTEIKEPLPMFPYPMSDSIQYPIFTPLNKEDGAETPSDSGYYIMLFLYLIQNYM